jgi:hypothetical protein
VIRCYVDNAPIEDPSQIDFHHIRPFSEDGPTSPDNAAPVCRDHHRRVGTLSLQEFRDRLELERFFEGGVCRLDDLLESRLGPDGFANSVTTEVTTGGTAIRLYWQDGSSDFPLYTCPVTGCRYFYALVPFRCVRNDVEIQPRPLEQKRVWELYRHFLLYTQLAPSVCRLVDGRILLFDGQHKAAAQVWCGRQQLECKVYIEPNMRAIKETILTAHDRLRQMPFYTSTLIEKYAALYAEDWQSYMEGSGQKSEAGVVGYLQSAKGLSRADVLKRMRSAMQDDVLDDAGNGMTQFVAERNRAQKTPLTNYALQRTFFSDFIAPPPLQLEFEGPDDFRQQERRNLVRLMSMVARTTLVGRWNPAAATAGHKQAERTYSIGSLRAWVPLLRDVVAQVLQLYEEQEKQRVLFRAITEDQWHMIEERVHRLFSHKVWADPDPEIDANLRINNAEQVRRFLRERGLSAAWVLGMSE